MCYCTPAATTAIAATAAATRPQLQKGEVPRHTARHIIEVHDPPSSAIGGSYFWRTSQSPDATSSGNKSTKQGAN